MTLTFPTPGPREVFVAKSWPTSPPTDSTKVDEARLEVTQGTLDANNTVFVWDRSNNHVASRPLAKFESGQWALKIEQYERVGLVRVRVEHRGQPVSAARLEAKSGAFRASVLIDPNRNGEVEIFGVPFGNLDLSVETNDPAGKAQTHRQIFPIELVRSQSVPELVVSVPTDTATVAATPSGEAKAGEGEKAAAAEGGKEPKAAPASANPIGTAITYLLVLAAMGGLGYYAIRYMKQNPDRVQKKLEELGVQVPPAGGGDPAPAPMPPPKAPEPPQKILLSDAAPEPLGTVAASPLPTGDWRLTMENGDAFPIPDGETVIGRDLGLGLSLAGESTVSRRHATLTRSAGSLRVRDEGSTNGTFVNGARLAGEQELRHGDQVQFGAVRFRVEG